MNNIISKISSVLSFVISFILLGQTIAYVYGAFSLPGIWGKDLLIQSVFSGLASIFFYHFARYMWNKDV